MIKHDTASVFVFHHHERHGWRLGLIQHPLFRVWMQPGGHVEPDETPREAALREAREETGLDGLRLVDAHRPPRLIATDTAVAMDLPVWIVEHPVPKGDNHLRQAHVHIDFKYLAEVDRAEPVTEPAHPFAWFTREQLRDVETFADVREVGAALFELMDARAAVA